METQIGARLERLREGREAARAAGGARPSPAKRDRTAADPMRVAGRVMKTREDAAAAPPRRKRRTRPATHPDVRGWVRVGWLEACDDIPPEPERVRDRLLSLTRTGRSACSFARYASRSSAWTVTRAPCRDNTELPSTSGVPIRYRCPNTGMSGGPFAAGARITATRPLSESGRRPQLGCLLLWASIDRARRPPATRAPRRWDHVRPTSRRDVYRSSRREWNLEERADHFWIGCVEGGEKSTVVGRKDQPESTLRLLDLRLGHAAAPLRPGRPIQPTHSGRLEVTRDVGCPLSLRDGTEPFEEFGSDQQDASRAGSRQEFTPGEHSEPCPRVQGTETVGSTPTCTTNRSSHARKRLNPVVQRWYGVGACHSGGSCSACV